MMINQHGANWAARAVLAHKVLAANHGRLPLPDGDCCLVRAALARVAGCRGSVGGGLAA